MLLDFQAFPRDGLLGNRNSCQFFFIACIPPHTLQCICKATKTNLSSFVIRDALLNIERTKRDNWGVSPIPQGGLNIIDERPSE
jgi:hypothetical protein